jgi:hypothetical protein
MKAANAKSERGLLRTIARRAKAEGRLKDRRPPAPKEQKPSEEPR